MAGIAGDRSRPLKHILRARIVLLSDKCLTVQEVARRASVSRPAVWRWQQRFAEEGVEGLVRDKTRPPGTPPHSTRTVAEVLALTCSEPPDEVTHWTGRARGHFPTDEAALKLLYLVLNRSEKAWKMGLREWAMVKAQFAVIFGERFTRAMEA